ncbi:MAG: DUF481 domain-containing protein [Longimicrobiales bacterium]|nr:DUF481 domain-containing protein [Longimicrobiales bacterium]
MGMGRRWKWVATFLVSALPNVLAAQVPPGPGAAETVSLYFDCQGFGCWDMDFFRREIPYVNWVRDRQDADVHVLVTTQTTGGGGRQYVLAFLGRGRFDGQNQDVQMNTAGDATSDEVRTAIVSRLRLGLGRYLAGTALADRLRVGVPEEGPGPGGARPQGPPPGAPAQDDPWDYWVFTVRGNAFLNGESTQRFSNLNSSVSANRTTDAWKLNFSGRYSRNSNSFELSDTTIETVREDWSASGLVVKSVTEHLSVGGSMETGRSTFLNEDFRWSVSPGIEFNVFPYSESSRRSFTFQALMEFRHWDYEAETIFRKTAETRVAGTLTSAYNVIQPWGRMALSLRHSRYLHDTDRYQLSLGGSVEVRLFKGFSVNMGGEYGRIRDQLYIAARGATDEEILLRQRQLSTNYRYYTSVGISYRFGSIFNNVVNPRFGHGGGGMTIMMF